MGPRDRVNGPGSVANPGERINVPNPSQVPCDDCGTMLPCKPIGRRPSVCAPCREVRANRRLCSIDNCGKRLVAHGFCMLHLGHLYDHGDPLWERSYVNKGKVCAVQSCDRPAEKCGWCASHYRRWRKTGDLQEGVPFRVMGEGSIDNGYRRLWMPDHPNANKTGCIHEHTVVMSETRE